MGQKERREREKAELRRRIVTAARELFEQRGYGATTMRDIADRIDYSPTVIYQHFENKDALISAVVAEDFRALTRGLVETGGVADPVVRLVRAVEEYIEFALEHPRQYELTFMSPDLAKADEHAPMGADASRRVYAFLRITSDEAIATKRFRPEFQDGEEVAQMIWSAMHGAVSLHLARKEDPWIDWGNVRRTALRTCATLIRGLSVARS